MRMLLLCASLLTLAVAPALAAGINLGWNDCPSGPTYALTKTFACDTNAGSQTLVGSFVAPAGIQKMSANEIIIEMQTDPGNPLFPAWWGLNSGNCRSGLISGDFNFTAGPFSCVDYWQGGAIGAIQMSAPVGSRAEIKGVFALPAGDSRITAVLEGQEIYSFKAVISNAKTVGQGSCPGCGAQACIVLRSIRLNQPPPLPMPYLLNPAVSAYVIWQAWNTVDPNLQCPQVTPVRNQTWGSIKSLYR